MDGGGRVPERRTKLPNTELAEVLATIFREGLSFIANRVRAYATDRGYADVAIFPPTAWESTVRGLTESLVSAIEDPTRRWDLHASEDLHSDLATRYGLIEARLLRARGVQLPVMLGLLKYYRRAYHDLLDSDSRVPDGRLIDARRIVTGYFDRIEVAVVGEWIPLADEQVIERLQSRNRDALSEKHLYSSVFDSIGHPIFLLDAEGKLHAHNAAAARDFGLADDPSPQFRGVMQGEPLVPLASEVEGLIREGRKQWVVERRFEAQYGDRTYSCAMKRIDDPTGRDGWILVILYDVTDRAQRAQEVDAQVTTRTKELADLAQQLHDANRTKSEFLAKMSHELRTPLNSVIGFSRILLDGLPGPVNPEQERQITMINSAGNHLLSLINDLLDLSKIEADHLDLALERFRMSDVVDEVGAMVRSMADSKGLAFQVDNELPQDLACDSDRHRITQVLINLLTNAVKYTEKGSVTLEARTEALGDDPSGLVVVTVSDTGIGIAPDRISAIFDEFARVGEPSSAVDSTGLGLAISKRLSSLLSGSLTVTSTQGAGSTFEFRVPRRHPNARLDI